MAKNSLTTDDLTRCNPPLSVGNMLGRSFGFLAVVSHAGKKGTNHYVWCVCVCGSSYLASSSHVYHGEIMSCGCKRKELIGKGNTRHGCCPADGKKMAREYQTWRAMPGRCRDKNQKNYKNYGGRGIKVCERWKDFANFLADMGERPPKMTLDRFPNQDGDYEPGNCRWATSQQQAENQLSNWPIILKGERMTAAEATRRLGFRPFYLYRKLYKMGVSKSSYIVIDEWVKP